MAGSAFGGGIVGISGAVGGQRIRLRSRLLLLLAGGFVIIHCSGPRSDLTLQEVRAENVLDVVQSHKDSAAVLVNFWATWCQPCVEEFPMIVDLSKRYASRGLIVYFVSTDWLDEKDKVVRFLEQHGVTGRSFIKNQEDNAFINGVWREWTGAVPFTIVYDRKLGNVIDYWESKQPERRFVHAIEKAVTTDNGGLL